MQNSKRIRMNGYSHNEREKSTQQNEIKMNGVEIARSKNVRARKIERMIKRNTWTFNETETPVPRQNTYWCMACPRLWQSNHQIKLFTWEKVRPRAARTVFFFIIVWFWWLWKWNEMKSNRWAERKIERKSGEEWKTEKKRTEFKEWSVQRLNEKIAESRGKKTFWAILGPFSMYEAISVKPLDSDRLSSNARWFFRQRLKWRNQTSVTNSHSN